VPEIRDRALEPRMILAPSGKCMEGKASVQMPAEAEVSFLDFYIGLNDSKGGGYAVKCR
jgi:hypothetical protein